MGTLQPKTLLLHVPTPTCDVKQPLSLENIAPPELSTDAALLDRGSAELLHIGKRDLALSDEGSAADPVLVQEPMRIVGILPAVVELEDLA